MSRDSRDITDFLSKSLKSEVLNKFKPRFTNFKIAIMLKILPDLNPLAINEQIALNSSVSCYFYKYLSFPNPIRPDRAKSDTEVICCSGSRVLFYFLAWITEWPPLAVPHFSVSFLVHGINVISDSHALVLTLGGENLKSNVSIPQLCLVWRFSPYLPWFGMAVSAALPRVKKQQWQVQCANQETNSTRSCYK